MKAFHIWIFIIHSLGDVGHYNSPLRTNILISTLLTRKQTLISFCHDPTLHPILAISRLQQRTYDPPTDPSLLLYWAKEKASIVLSETLPYMTHYYSFHRQWEDSLQHCPPPLRRSIFADTNSCTCTKLVI